MLLAWLLLLLLATAAQAQSISIAWDAPTLASGQAINGYQLARCPLPAGATTCTCTPALLPGVTTTATTLTHTPPAGAFCYSVITLGTVNGQAAVSILATPYVLAAAGAPPLTAPPTLQVLPLVTSSRLSVTADSQEMATKPPSRATDGNPATFWHTQWVPTTPPLPHWLRLDLPGTWWITGLRYLSRQDEDLSNGKIADYRVEVLGTDGRWQEVAKGSWPSAGLGWREVRWPAVLATAVKLWSLREIHNGPWASASEIQLIQGSQQ